MRIATASMCVFTAAAAALAGAAPRPLVTTRLRIVAVAQDGSRLAWIGGSCYGVRVRSLRTGSQTLVGDASAAECGPLRAPILALAGTRALWVVTSSGNNLYADVMTSAPGERQRRLAGVVGASTGGDGDYVTGVAGDGSTLVFSTVTMSELDTCIDPGTPCFYFARAGSVRRIVGRTARRIPGLRPAAEIAVSGRRIALVAAQAKGTSPEPAPSTEVDVHDTVSGTLVSRFFLNGRPLAVGLGPRLVAVLENGRCPRCRLIEWHAARTGKWLGVTSVPNDATDLSMSGQNVVFRSGRSIYFASAFADMGSRIAVARSTPVGLSIEGRRVVWSERTRGTSRIVAVVVD